MFDKYISLGDNCEAGLNFSRIGYEYSSLLRFAMTPTMSLLSLFDNKFKDLFVDVIPVSNNMCQCKKYGISFHTRMRSEITDGNRTYKKDIDVEFLHKEDIAKISYLREKLISDMHSKDNILYILKSNAGINKNDALDIFSRIKAYGGNPNLLILTTSNENYFECENIYHEIFPRFAPYSNAYSYDSEAWDYIFSKYPLNQHEFNIQTGLVSVEL